MAPCQLARRKISWPCMGPVINTGNIKARWDILSHPHYLVVLYRGKGGTVAPLDCTKSGVSRARIRQSPSHPGYADDGRH